MSDVDPALSIVVCGRNDDYGGDFVGRMVRMLASLDQAARVLPPGSLEVIVVDWNVVPGRPALREVLPAPQRVCLRVVEVPHDAHRRVVHDSARPFHEYAAKNVGVVRARSQRVVVANPDVIIRPDLVRFCVREPLGNDAFVRADRYDFRPIGGPEDALVPPQTRVFAAHLRHAARVEDHISVRVKPNTAPRRWPRSRRLPGERGASVIRGPRGGLPGHFVRGAHANASGDYLCVSKASWRAVGGYSEDPGAVLHTDALLVAQLLGANLSQVIYAKPGALLHEDHPRASDEEPGCRAAAWPAFLERMQSIIDSRCSPRLNVGPIGLEHLELPISTIN